MSDMKSNTYLYGQNATFIEELYHEYIKNPHSIDESWREFFQALGDAPEQVDRSYDPAPWSPRENNIIGRMDPDAIRDKSKQGSANQNAASMDDVRLSIAAIQLIDNFRFYGHLQIQSDPLGLVMPEQVDLLDQKNYGITEEDFHKEIYIGGRIKGIEKITFIDLFNFLRSAYSTRLGAEFMHIESCEERAWLQDKLEQHSGSVGLEPDERKSILQELIEVEGFESFLHNKFPGMKRFSVEGAESSVVATNMAIKKAVEYGVREVVIGMAHRGRLSTLTKVMKKPYHRVFSEFQGELAFPENLKISGDVKYHLGASSDTNIDGHEIHLSLTPNPSHLEAVNSVVAGKVRAKQDMRGDQERGEVLGLLVHGDAAFSGQGSVYESLSLSQLKAYSTGGTIHIVVNNQIGFTTEPKDSRSSRYCTDIAKGINAPVFHVSGDDPDNVAYVTQLAAEYRAKFKKDVIIDIVCYRKYGHNEGDEPMFTQPIMYKAIAKKPSADRIYAQMLISQGLISEEEFQKAREDFKSFLDAEFEKSKDYKPDRAEWLEGKWQHIKAADVETIYPITGVDKKLLEKVAAKICEVPKDFKANSKIERLLQQRSKMLAGDVDWGMGEALAYGTLLCESSKVRITGQDVKRGTFSHRHAAVFDQDTQKEYIPLNHIQEGDQAELEIHNSHLSEFAVLGFEFGYSFTDPDTLTIWEAQFGDFANGAQVIIDQYISSSEHKWLRMNGLVLLLPHGYEGQGPEHSSARPERFLQLCAQENIIVVNCTTPASFFHALRRQLKMSCRKPLVVMSPKSLLRHKLAVSKKEDFIGETTFRCTIPEQNAEIVKKADKVKRVVLCSGKVYYDLYEEREKRKLKDIAFIRVEQLYPFSKSEVGNELLKYPDAEVVWCQEEPRNMGYFYHIRPRLEKLLKQIKFKHKEIIYAGRGRAPSPAVGYMKLHTREQEKLINDALDLNYKEDN
jgi:2-oxoglutarate dehydrogenase E1 component